MKFRSEPVTKQRVWGWMTKSTDKTVLQVPRALIVSGLAAILDVGLLILFVEWFKMPPSIAAIISYCIGGVLQYILCAIWVFPAAPKNAVTGFIAFTLLSFVGLVITWLVIYIAYNNFGLHYLLAKLIALALAFTWNFLSRKILIFKRGSCNDGNCE